MKALGEVLDLMFRYNYSQHKHKIRLRTFVNMVSGVPSFFTTLFGKDQLQMPPVFTIN